MTQTVIHQSRVAWDGARAFIRAARDPGYEEFARQVHGLLGPDARAALAESRERIAAAEVRLPGDRHATDVEAGRWRVRLEDLLRSRPDLVPDVLDLTERAPRWS
jgi:hypothetical protein